MHRIRSKAEIEALEEGGREGGRVGGREGDHWKGE
jgi:hypothetical protein